MKYLKNLFVLFIATCLSAVSLTAQTRLPSILSDNMCLQQLTEVKIWGWDNPGQPISVEPSWTEPEKTETDNKGNWLVTIKTPEAGGPHKIKINGSSEQVISNVLMGEVWVCSGQSNMDRQLGLRPGQMPLVNF